MSERGMFNGKLGFIIATSASAVGLGNIWRFPTQAAGHGGGTFLLIYIAVVLIFGLSMLITEISIGRATRKSPVKAYKELNPKYRIIGILGVVVPALILPYYCVIGGWLVGYQTGYLMDADMADPGLFSDFAGSAEAVVAFLVFSAVVGMVVYFGVTKGIEKSSLVFMPIFILLLIGLTIYGLLQPGSADGVEYYLSFDLSNLGADTFTAALGQAFFSLSIAMGILITYGSYMSREENIERCSVAIITIDTLVAVLAGLLIIPMAYTHFGGDIEGGASLVFITLPNIFADMPGGIVVANLFFVMLLFAAITSAVSILEAVSSTVIDNFGISRHRAIVLVMIPALVAGTLISLGFGPLSFIEIAGNGLLDIFDYVSNNLLMPIVAILTCIFVGHVLGTKFIEDEVERSGSFVTKRLYPIMIKWVCPILVAIIFMSNFISF